MPSLLDLLDIDHYYFFALNNSQRKIFVIWAAYDMKGGNMEEQFGVFMAMFISVCEVLV